MWDDILDDIYIYIFNPIDPIQIKEWKEQFIKEKPQLDRFA